MGEYRLRRTQSVVFVPRAMMEDRPPITLMPVKSEVDFSMMTKFEEHEKYLPKWSFPTYRYRRNWDLYDDNYRERFHYSAPLCTPSSVSTRHYYDPHGAPNPYKWLRGPYKGFSYAYDYPGFSRKYKDPFYASYYSNPYRSYLLDTMSDRLERGFRHYREGTIPFSSLHNNYLSHRSWDARFKNHNNLYAEERNHGLLRHHKTK
uniref:Uncharacterized protein n=2 Tax=Plectus sambesii TaxID=2011161 RepID=A0A914VUL5_9BILA